MKSKSSTVSTSDLNVALFSSALCTTTLTLLSLLAATNSAQAATVKFTDLASFQANTTRLTTINFESLSTNYYGNTLTTQGVTFNDSDSLLNVVSPSRTIFNWNSGQSLDGDGTTDTITAILPSGITAVGSDIMSFNDISYNPTRYIFPFTITLSNGETVSLDTLNNPNREFIGFTSDAAISSISFQANGGRTLLDNFTFGTAKSVPEPFTVIGSLVGGTAALRMRKKLKAVAK